MLKKNLNLIIVVFLSMALFSCQKVQLNKNSTTSTDDQTTAENTFSDVYSTVMEEVDEDETEVEGGGRSLSGEETCKTVTVVVDSVAETRTRTVDFGEECLGVDGKMRSGKIIITIKGKRKEAESYFNVTFENYFVDGTQIEGVKTITNNGLNELDQWYYTITITGAKITNTDGDVISWESNRVRTMVEGSETLIWTDDVYEITGSSSGTNVEGKTFTHTITTALRKEVGYRHIVSGVVEIAPADLDVRTIDFGTGERDAVATVTVNGTSKEIDLTKRNGKLRGRGRRKR